MPGHDSQSMLWEEVDCSMHMQAAKEGNRRVPKKPFGIPQDAKPFK
jgi:hypothetical protein